LYGEKHKIVLYGKQRHHPPQKKKNEVKKKASGFPYESLALAFDFLARYNQLDFVAF
jgi:hypothetical protein